MFYMNENVNLKNVDYGRNEWRWSQSNERSNGCCKL